MNGFMPFYCGGDSWIDSILTGSCIAVRPLEAVQEVRLKLSILRIRAGISWLIFGDLTLYLSGTHAKIDRVLAYVRSL